MLTTLFRVAYYTTRKSYDEHIGLQVFRRNDEDLQEFLADKKYSWGDLREECREESTRPVIKHNEQTSLQKAYNARIDDDLYHQWTMSETVFSLLKENAGKRLRSRTWHGQFRASTARISFHQKQQDRSANTYSIVHYPEGTCSPLP